MNNLIPSLVYNVPSYSEHQDCLMLVWADSWTPANLSLELKQAAISGFLCFLKGNFTQIFSLLPGDAIWACPDWILPLDSEAKEGLRCDKTHLGLSVTYLASARLPGKPADWFSIYHIITFLQQQPACCACLKTKIFKNKLFSSAKICCLVQILKGKGRGKQTKGRNTSEVK